MVDKKQLIVMLTYNDKTVLNARAVFEECKNSRAPMWGMKEMGLPVGKTAELFASMKACGKTTVLEVVEYEKEECLKSLEIVKKCKCDILMGTCYYDEINDFCKSNSIKYMPYVGTIHGRPSVLTGEIDDIIQEAKDCLKKGVYGIDLLCYRYDKNPDELYEKCIHSIDGPVCIAGDINSYDRLNTIIANPPWGFTVGSAFFENKFGESIFEQIEKVCEYVDC